MANLGVIVVAGGLGSRMGSLLPKQFLMLCGESILTHTLRTISELTFVKDVVVVLPEGYNDATLPYKTCIGGGVRFESVKNGLAVLDECDYIAVHDAVRPLATKELYAKVFDVAQLRGGAIPVVEPVDSFRIVLSNEGSEVIKRSSLRAVQTPQIFRADILRRAYLTPFDEKFTDDASVVEHLGERVALCEGEQTNIKITTPIDIVFGEAILKLRAER